MSPASPQCRVEPNLSPTFHKLRVALKKTYPNIDEDLKQAFAAIAHDYRKAKNGRSMPGFNDRVFKYRQNSSDIKRGASYGFRIIGYYSEGVLYPIIIYAKPQLSDVSDGEIEEALKEMEAILKSN